MDKNTILLVTAALLFILGIMLNYASTINIPLIHGDLFDQAAYNAGVTASYLKHRKAITRDYLDNIATVTNGLSNRRNHLLEDVNVDYDELRRVDAYYNLSTATLIVADNLEEYSSVYGRIEASLKLLNSGRSDEALITYVLIRGLVMKLIDEFGKAYNMLKSTDTRYYPDKHLEKYTYLRDEVKKALDLLREYEKLMEYILEHSNYIGSPNGGYKESVYISIGGDIMKKIDLSKFGELSSDVSDLLTSMLSNTNNTGGTGGEPTGSSSGGELGTGGGTGGGPGGPSSDD